MKQETKLITFLDSVGRTVLGESCEEKTTNEILAVKNPAVVAISPQPQGGLQLQILPLFFKEFLADKNEATTWLYRKDNITLCDNILFDFKLNAQYQQLFAPVQAQPQQQSTPDVVKLFDDE
jgi:hypothetical protein